MWACKYVQRRSLAHVVITEYPGEMFFDDCKLLLPHCIRQISPANKERPPPLYSCGCTLQPGRSHPSPSKTPAIQTKSALLHGALLSTWFPSLPYTQWASWRWICISPFIPHSIYCWRAGPQCSRSGAQSSSSEEMTRAPSGISPARTPVAAPTYFLHTKGSLDLYLPKEIVVWRK